MTLDVFCHVTTLSGGANRKGVFVTMNVTVLKSCVRSGERCCQQVITAQTCWVPKCDRIWTRLIHGIICSTCSCFGTSAI